MGSKATQPRKRLGAWLVRANNTVYQAATDGFVLAARLGAGQTMDCRTDSANPPTIVRQAASPGIDQYDNVTVPVRKGHYWKVEQATHYIFWIPNA